MSDAPVCLIPARGGSKRFPRKNIAPLEGKPLLGWTVEAAVESGVFTRVVVSTDDGEVADVARRHGAEAVMRDAQLASDTATVVQVTLDFADRLAAAGRPCAALCVTLPTAALARAEDFRGAAALFDEHADFVMAVTRFSEPPFWALHEVDGYLTPVWPDLMKRSQDLPRTFVDCGYFYFARVAALREERTFYGRRLRAYSLPRERSVDIDHPEDLTIARALLRASADAAQGGSA